MMTQNIKFPTGNFLKKEEKNCSKTKKSGSPKNLSKKVLEESSTAVDDSYPCESRLGIPRFPTTISPPPHCEPSFRQNQSWIFLPLENS